LQCLVGVLRSLGTWTSKQRGNGPVFPDLSVPALEVHADGAHADDTDLEVKDDTKPVTQADEFEKAKALKVTMESAVAKVLPFGCHETSTFIARWETNVLFDHRS